MKDFNAALLAYRNAVAARAFWKDHGSHGDGKLEEAKRAEAAALRKVRAAALAMAGE